MTSRLPIQNLNDRNSILTPAKLSDQNALEMHAFQPKTGHLFGSFFPKNNAIATNSPLLTLRVTYFV